MPARRSPPIGPLARRIWWRSLRVKVAVITALPVVAVIAMGQTLLALQRQDGRDDERVRQLIEVDAQASRVWSLAVDAETGVRGYLATGDEHFLALEVRARRQLPGTLRALTSLVRGGPERQRALADAIERQGGQLETLTELRAGAASAQQISAALRQEEATADEIRSLITSLQRENRLLLAKRDASRARGREQARRVAFMAAGVGVAGGVGGSILLIGRLVVRVRRVE